MQDVGLGINEWRVAGFEEWEAGMACVGMLCVRRDDLLCHVTKCAVGDSGTFTSIEGFGIGFAKHDGAVSAVSEWHVCNTLDVWNSCSNALGESGAVWAVGGIHVSAESAE